VVTLEIAPVEHALSYVWYKDGEVIPTVTATSYTVTESGTYAVTGVNIAGEEGEKSEKTVIINPCVLPAPVITPFKDTPCEMGLTITQPVEYAVSYIWLKDGVAIPGATTASYTAFESGVYTVAAVNAAATTGEVSAGYPVTISPCTPAAAGTIQGASVNDCSAGSATSKEANTVELTIPEIALASSYTWYYNGGGGEVEMQTGDSRSYTAVISGSYTVKGVSPAGDGAPSPVKVVNITPCFAYAFGGDYNRLQCQRSTLNPSGKENNMVEPFLSIYETTHTALMNTASTGTTVPYIRVNISAASTMQLSLIDRTNALINFSYVLNREADGTLYFTNVTHTYTATTATGIKMQAVGGDLANSIIGYFLYSSQTGTMGPSGNTTAVTSSGNKFRLGWIPNNNGQTGILFGLYLVSDPHSYIPGVLSKY
jgi:hypothetical protein